MTQSASSKNSPTPLDATRVALVLGVVATLTFAWLWSLSMVSADMSAVPWVLLQIACLGVVLGPTMAGAHGKSSALVVSAVAAAVITTLALVVFALGLVPMQALTLVAAAVSSVLAVAAVAILHRAPAGAPPIYMSTVAAETIDVRLPGEVQARKGKTMEPGFDTPTPKPKGDATWVPGGDESQNRFQPGVKIGRYTLDARLAVGGMGEVWRAHHETLIRPAVLKIIKRAGDSPAKEDELVERFRREAVTTANLTSPHTVHLYDFGVESDSALYIAMELLEAMSIGAIVTRFGPMEDSRIAFLLRQACHSLIEAHDSGVVHRDIKPDNLLVTRAGRDTDFLKVIDFGLVKDLTGKKRSPTSGKHQRVQQLTALGARPGTPGYMAPEQIGGNVVDQRADIYALACVAYFALTGLPVFEGTEDAQLMFAHMQVEPESPSQRLGRPVHAGLEAVVMRCLAKNPIERPESMTALDQAIAALTFEQPWSQERARAWWTDERMKLRTRARDSVQADGANDAATLIGA